MFAHRHDSLDFTQRLVLVSSDPAQAASIAAQFEEYGWEAHLADSGWEARQLTRTLAPDLVVLDTEHPDESGWLTCAKLVKELPHQEVILMTDEVNGEKRRFAKFVGASAIAPYDEIHPENLEDVQEERYVLVG